MYAQKFECPECGESLSANARKCSCGWNKSESNQKKDHRCIFVLNGKRCNLPGSLSPSVKKSDDWMCKYHFLNRDDFHESSRWVSFIENHFHEIVHFRKHYQTNFENCERCKKLCSAEDDFMKNERKAPEEVIY
jgi:hypothetical protein